MIILGSKLINAPIMSLQTGTEVALTERELIDPEDLAIIGYDLKGPLIRGDVGTFIRLADIRELSDLGFIIDSIDEFIKPSEVVKVQAVHELGFQLVGIDVRDEKRKKLGKVIDYTLDTGVFVVQQLTVRRPLIHSFNDTELVIHSSQIIEISKDCIVVHSEAKVPEPSRNEVPGAYVNPFRKTRPMSEAELTDER